MVLFLPLDIHFCTTKRKRPSESTVEPKTTQKKSRVLHHLKGFKLDPSILSKRNVDMLDDLYQRVDKKETWRPIFTPLQNHFLNWLLLVPLLPEDWAKLIVNTIRYGADPTYFIQPPPKQDQVNTNCETEEELYEALKCVQNNMCLKNSGNSTLSGPYSSKEKGKLI